MKAVLAALAALLIAGCAGSTPEVTTQTVTVTRPSSPPPSSTGTITLPASPANGTITLPASSSPTSCTVYMDGHAANVVFASTSLVVNPECLQWIQTMAQEGVDWSEDGSQAVTDTNVPGGGVICVLEDGQGNVRATIDDQGYGTYGHSACTSLVASGWIQQSLPASTSTSTSSAPTPPVWCNAAGHPEAHGHYLCADGPVDPEP